MHLIYRLCRNISYIVLGGDAAGVSLMIACYKRLALTTGGKPLHPVEDAASMVVEDHYAEVAAQFAVPKGVLVVEEGEVASETEHTRIGS